MRLSGRGETLTASQVRLAFQKAPKGSGWEVGGDGDERLLGGRRGDLVPRRTKQTEYKSHRRREQMECDFLLRAHGERSEIIAHG